MRVLPRVLAVLRAGYVLLMVWVFCFLGRPAPVPMNTYFLRIKLIKVQFIQSRHLGHSLAGGRWFSWAWGRCSWSSSGEFCAVGLSSILFQLHQTLYLRCPPAGWSASTAAESRSSFARTSRRSATWRQSLDLRAFRRTKADLSLPAARRPALKSWMCTQHHSALHSGHELQRTPGKIQLQQLLKRLSSKWCGRSGSLNACRNQVHL